MSTAISPDITPASADRPVTTDSRRKATTLRAAALLALGLYVVAFRAHTATEPPECDHGTYAVIGHELIRGRALYSDLWDIKPPTIYLSYAAAEAIVGYGKVELLALEIFAALITLIGVAWAGDSLGRGGGLLAAAFWAVASSDPDLQANQPNSEVFINALLAWSFVAVARLWPGPGGTRLALAAGVLLALASTYKQVVVFVAFALALALLATTRPKRAALAQVLWIALPGLLLWAAMGVYFAASGRFDIFWRTNFLFSSRYSGNLWENVASSLVVPNAESLAKKAILVPMALLTVVAFLARGDGRCPRALSLMAAWAAGTLVAVAAPGRFWPHYYQLWLPTLAVGAGWGGAAIARGLRSRCGAIAWAPGLIVLANGLWIELPHATVPPEIWSHRKYGDNFLESERFGRSLSELLKPGETFYQWGPHPEVYFAAGLRPPVGVLWDDPLFEGPMQAELSTRTLAELEANPPDLVGVYKTKRNAGHRHPILDWVEAGYKQIPGSRPHDDPLPELYVRPGGALEARLVPFDRDTFRRAGGGGRR